MCKCVRLLLCEWRERSRCTTDFGGESFFMATSCWGKGILWLQDIVSLKYDFYYWRAASREQRVGVIIPVIAVWASEGIICPEFIAKDRTSWTTCCWDLSCVLPRRQTTQIQTHTHKYSHVVTHKETCMLKYWHKHTIEYMHVGSYTNANVATWTDLW